MIAHRLSLSQRLLVALLIASFGYWAVIAWLTIRDSVDQVYELFDTHLAQTAVALMRVSDTDDSDPEVEIANSADAPTMAEVFKRWPDLPERLGRRGDGLGNKQGAGIATPPLVAAGRIDQDQVNSLYREYERQLRYQIWYRNHLLMRSTTSPETAMTEQDGFSETTDGDGQVWRHFGLWDRHHDFRVVVSEAHDIRNQLVRSIALHVTSPLMLGLPVLLFLLWFSISRGLNPLSVIAREIESRAPDVLTPLDADRVPGEVRPMVLALNTLLGRMDQTLESERRFTANAAHELRTPLAAIQAQLHAVRLSDDKAERLHRMDQLQRAVDRGMRLVGQLLTLARLDPEQALPEVESVAIGAVAEAVCAELAPLALQRDQELELEIAPDLPPIFGNADLLSVLVSNLVDNAIRYTPKDGHIKATIREEGKAVVIEVVDNGPGIPVAQRERVFDRFFRLADQTKPGTGLGLTICRRIAELHHARVELADGPGGTGLTVRVFLPAEAQ